MELLKGRTPLILAAALALIAGLLAFLGLNDRERRLSAKWDPVRVVAAGENLSRGSTISAAKLRPIDVPRKFVNSSMITVEQFDDLHLTGQKLTVDMAEGDPLLQTFVEASAERSRGFSSIITGPRARAVSIRVGPDSSVSNWIRPGDRVDVLNTFRDPKSGDNVTLTLLEGVIVLATGNLTGYDSFVPQSQRNYNTVTLQVLPEAAEILVLAQTLGALYLTLRNPSDAEIQADARSSATSLQTILNGERAKFLSKTQTKTFQNIQVIRGRDVETKSFERTP